MKTETCTRVLQTLSKVFPKRISDIILNMVTFCDNLQFIINVGTQECCCILITS